MSRYSSIAIFIVSGVTAASAAISCSSEETQLEASDAAPDATSSTTDAAGAVDAGEPDAPLVLTRDAAAFDGGPLPVVCATPPCATSLVTTFPPEFGFTEGYCALLDDGTVACWGSNGSGQLGRGEDAGTADDARAERVVELSDVTALDHTCALDKSGAVWCWGTGVFLQNDAGASTTTRAPTKLALPPAKLIAMGLDVSCAVVEDGVLCWGRNNNGLIAPLDVSPLTARLPATSVGVPPGAPIHDLRVGKAAFAVRDDGVTLSWGATLPLGRLSSMVPDPNPTPLALRDISSIDVTADSACATALGIAYCWGRAVTGATIFDRLVPTAVATPEPVVQIAATQAVSKGVGAQQPQRWCAVGASGAVYCWGYNGGGQAGDGTKNHAYEAVKVQGLPAPAAQVRALPESTCALLTNGKVHCWGTNYYGQLGNGKIRIPSLVPQEVVLP